MTESVERITGGCLCCALRSTATGAAQMSGICRCGGCRKASASGFIPHSIAMDERP